MEKYAATIRFYEELNDFLPKKRRKTRFEVVFKDTPAIKDLIESIGVPHTEIDMILVNGISVDFSYRVQNGDDIAVYPVFEAIDISSVTHLRPVPLRRTAFILDVHLGKLARFLRLLGFDTLYRNDYDDDEIVAIAQAEKRIVLTRDIGIFKHNAVTHGYWVRSTNINEQIYEIVDRFDLRKQCKPYTRCLACNGVMKAVEKEEVESQLNERTRKYYNSFSQCVSCGKLYWKGAHFKKLDILVEDICGGA